MNQLTIEEIQAMYVDKQLAEPPQKIYRYQRGSERFYYTFDEDGEPMFYQSITSMIGNNLKSNYTFNTWQGVMNQLQSFFTIAFGEVFQGGNAIANAYAEERAHYGTFMHIEYAELLINRKVDFQEVEMRLEQYIEDNNLNPSFINHLQELKKDIWAFALFVKEYKVKPLAIEIGVISKEGFGCVIDLPCELDIEQKGFWGEVYKSGPRKGDPKETKKAVTIRAIIDFKSGRKGFHESHSLQLEGCKRAWNENFPNFPIDKVFNFAPKDWKGDTPTYHLKEWETEPAKLDALISLARIENSKLERSILDINGVIDLDNLDMSGIKKHNISQIIKTKKS